MKKRTVVWLVVIASCVIFFGFMALIAIVSLSGDFNTEFTGFGDKVAVVELYGQIVNSREFVRQVKKWTEDGSVKAIVVDIDSPGGGVAASQEMYDQLLKAREAGKIIVVSMSSVAASGGYYVACAGDKIMANPGTLTGSIGVIMSYPTAQKLFDKIGIKYETIKSGELKDVGSMDRSMTPEEERMLKGVIDDTYEQFVEAVSEGRNKTKEEVYPFADGSIFTGRQAYNYGLVDTLGTFEDAVSLAGELTNLGPDPDIVQERKRTRGLLEALAESAALIQKLSSNLEETQPSMKFLYR